MLCEIATFFMSALRPSAAATTKESAPGSEASSASFFAQPQRLFSHQYEPAMSSDERQREDRKARRPGLHLVDGLLRDAGSGIDAEDEEDRRRPEAGKVGVDAGERGDRDGEQPAGDPGGRHAEKFGDQAARGADEER